MHLPEKHDTYKQESQEQVANIAPYIVKGSEGSSGMGTLEVVVAGVLVATLVQDLQKEVRVVR